MKTFTTGVLAVFLFLFANGENIWATGQVKPRPVEVGNGLTFYPDHYIGDTTDPHRYPFPDENVVPFSVEYDFDISFVYLRYRVDYQQPEKKRYAVFDKNSLEMSASMTWEEFHESEHVVGKTIQWQKQEPPRSFNMGFILLELFLGSGILPVLIVVLVLVFIFRMARRDMKMRKNAPDGQEES